MFFIVLVRIFRCRSIYHVIYQTMSDSSWSFRRRLTTPPPHRFHGAAEKNSTTHFPLLLFALPPPRIVFCSLIFYSSNSNATILHRSRSRSLPSARFTVALRTVPSADSTSTTLASLHSFLATAGSTTRTRSFISQFFRVFVHFFLSCSDVKYNRDHADQNALTRSLASQLYVL